MIDKTEELMYNICIMYRNEPKKNNERRRSMRIAGIICECNPLHGGHLYLMRKARRQGVDGVVCVMSGCFTQRGEAAIAEPRLRAKMILAEGGADAVLELPFPYSAAGAEYFASAGVSLLDRLGVDELWFGSECGEIETLKRAAEISMSDVFSQTYRERCRGHATGTAQGYLELLREMGGADGLLSNDILGIAYCKAVMARGSSMRPVTIKRQGSGYLEKTLKEGALPSASALREALAIDGIASWRPYLSEKSLKLAESEMQQGRAPASLLLAERGILAALRLISPDRLDQTPEFSGGLGRRVAELSHAVTGLQELLERSVTKKYTEARVRRGILFALTGVEDGDLRREPAYAVLLAANETGCRFLAERKKSRSVAVVTCHGDLPKDENSKRQEQLTRAAFALYGMMLPTPQTTDVFLRRSSEILR